MLKKEKSDIFKQALSRAFAKLAAGTSATTVASSYDIPPAIISGIRNGKKDPQMSTFYRIAEAYDKDPAEFTAMVFAELPKGFMFADE